MKPCVALALVHYPVVDRNRRVVTSAVTNLDLHDLARTARTYGAGRLFLVTPEESQRRLAQRILRHWREGFGAAYNPDRAEALHLVEPAADLESAIGRWEDLCGCPIQPLLTGARVENGLSFAAARRRLEKQPVMLVLGTGWGLAPSLFEGGWPALKPLRGSGDYNHLPVRAAAAIILDRLCGRNV
jgi:hypothetical protein